MKDLCTASEICVAELVHPHVTGADLNYQGSITIDQDILTESDLLPGQMVYIDNIARPAPPWRTYIVPGEAGKGGIIMNGPPAHHFQKGDPVTIRGGALISSEDEPIMAGGHTKVFFSQDAGAPNRVESTEHIPVPPNHWRQMCVSKLHRLVITGTSPDGPEALVIDEHILDVVNFPVGLEVQFTSIRDGALRRTCIQAGSRGTGTAEIHGSAAQYVVPGIRIITLAEKWCPYGKAIKIGGPQVAFFDESLSERNVIRDVKTGMKP